MLCLDQFLATPYQNMKLTYSIDVLLPLKVNTRFLLRWWPDLYVDRLPYIQRVFFVLKDFSRGGGYSDDGDFGLLMIHLRLWSFSNTFDTARIQERSKSQFIYYDKFPDFSQAHKSFHKIPVASYLCSWHRLNSLQRLGLEAYLM